VDGIMTTKDNSSPAALEVTPVLEEASPAVASPQPKNIDALMQSTARFSRQGWHAFLSMKDNLEQITYKRLALHLTARNEAGAKAVALALEAVSVPAVKVKGLDIHTITTFAKLQAVIKHPDLKHVDATVLD
jgi:hypothetical protein